MIDLLEPQKRAAIVRRIAIMVLPGPEIVGELANTIRRRAEKGRGEREETGWSRVVKILNTMRPAAERQLLGRLAGTNPDLLHNIRSAMFGPNVIALCQPAGTNRPKPLSAKRLFLMEMLISGKNLKGIAAVSNVTVQTI